MTQLQTSRCWLRGLLLVSGSIGVLGFLATGQYMKIALDGMQGMADAPRLLYRSAHIYLLWAGLANLLAGVLLAPATVPLARWAQRLAATLLLVTVPLFAASFFIESPLGQLDRPLASLGNYLGAAGALLAVYAAWLGPAGSPKPGQPPATSGSELPRQSPEYRQG